MKPVNYGNQEQFVTKQKGKPEVFLQRGWETLWSWSGLVPRSSLHPGIRLLGPEIIRLLTFSVVETFSCINVWYLAQRCKHVMKILIVYESIPGPEKGHVWWNVSQIISSWYFDQTCCDQSCWMPLWTPVFHLLLSAGFHALLLTCPDGDGAFWDILIKTFLNFTWIWSWLNMANTLLVAL